VGVAGDDEAGPTPSSTLAQRSGGEMRVTIWSSRWGVAWQKRTPSSASTSGSSPSARDRSAPSSRAVMRP
jgi:hypothetical protein